MGSAFDLGINRKAFDRKLKLSLGMANAGTNMGLGNTVAPLPLTFKGAAAWHFSHNLAMEADYSYEAYDFLNTLRLGGEYSYPLGDETDASFRAGYVYGAENAAGGLSGFCAGLGAHWRAWSV